MGSGLVLLNPLHAALAVAPAGAPAHTSPAAGTFGIHFFLSSDTIPGADQRDGRPPHTGAETE